MESHTLLEQVRFNTNRLFPFLLIISSIDINAFFLFCLQHFSWVTRLVAGALVTISAKGPFTRFDSDPLPHIRASPHNAVLATYVVKIPLQKHSWLPNRCFIFPFKNCIRYHCKLFSRAPNCTWEGLDPLQLCQASTLLLDDPTATTHGPHW